MSKYLFLTSEFMPSADASGICVYNVSRELIRNGHKVIVICEGQNGEHRFYEGIEVYEVKPSLFKFWQTKSINSKKKFDLLVTQAIKYLRRLIRIITLFSFPDVSPLRTKKEYKLLTKIYKHHSLDYVIGAFRPYESIGVVNKFKRNNPEICTIALYWDLIRSKNPFGRKFYKFFDYMCYRNEKKTFTINDKILIPVSGKSTFETERFDYAKSKIQYYDFPVFPNSPSDNLLKADVCSNEDVVNILCLGTIDDVNRSTAYFFKLMDKLYNTSNVKFHIHMVGSFSDMRIYGKYHNKDYVTFHGTVNYSEVPNYINKANFLVNIGNIIIYDMIPSKIFEFFASCKPILYIIRHREDKTIEYFERYPQVCNIYEYNNEIESDVKKIEAFLSCKDIVPPDFHTVEKLYESSKPEYFVRKFLN